MGQVLIYKVMFHISADIWYPCKVSAQTHLSRFRSATLIAFLTFELRLNSNFSGSGKAVESPDLIFGDFSLESTKKYKR